MSNPSKKERKKSFSVSLLRPHWECVGALGGKIRAGRHAYRMHQAPKIRGVVLNILSLVRPVRSDVSHR